MKKTIPILAAGIIVMLAACTKSGNEYTPVAGLQSNRVRSLNAVTQDPAANPENPYDYIGAYHNIILDSLRHYASSNHDTTRAGKAAYLNRYFKFHFGVPFQPFVDPKEMLACTDYKAVMLTQKVSAPAQVFLVALSDALESIKDLSHFDAYKQQISTIEKGIIAAGLPENESRNLLVTASILRYSGFYWINAFNSGEVVQHTRRPLSYPDGWFRKIIGVIVGIGADASVVAGGYMSGDYSLIGDAVTWSEVCGYYTGWW